MVILTYCDGGKEGWIAYVAWQGHSDSEPVEIVALVVGHSLICSLVCSHLSLVHQLCTARSGVRGIVEYSEYFVQYLETPK